MPSTFSVAIALLAAFLYADEKLELTTLLLPAPARAVQRFSPSALPKPPSKGVSSRTRRSRTRQRSYVPRLSCCKSVTGLQGVLDGNTLLLDHSTRVLEGRLMSPETIAVGPGGDLYVVDDQNFVRRMHGKGADIVLDDKPWVHLGPGQGLALEFDAAGNLFVCVAGAGLYMVENNTRKVVLLTARVSASSAEEPSTPLGYTDDLTVSSTGKIYFTDASRIPPVAPDYKILPPLDMTIFEGALTGRLLSYDPSTSETEVLVSKLWFANGCALAEDESYILVADTIAAKIYKHHLKGRKAGHTELLLEGLPGHPDNLRLAKDGTFWVGMSGRLLDKTLAILKYRYVRALAAWLPERLRPPLKPYGGIAQFSGDGAVLRYLEDPDGDILSGTASVTEGPEGLYIGSFTQQYFGYFPYASLPAVSNKGI